MPSVGQDEDSGPQPDSKIVNQVKQAWFDEINAKTLPLAFRDLPARMEKLNDQEEHCYLSWTNQYSLDKAKELGIPLEKEVSKLEITTKPFVVHLKGMKGAVLDGRKLLVADFQQVLYDYPSHYPILYLLDPSGPKMLEYGGGGCSEFNLIKPGSKAPTFILLKSSACGSGFGEILYELKKDGSLKKVAELGGWHAGIIFADLDGNGFLDIIDSSDELSTPKSLLERLKKVKNYNPYHGGSEAQHTRILRWSGNSYVVAGEFYDFSGY